MDLFILLDIVGIMYAGFAAPAWSKMIKNWSFAAARPNDFDTAKDFTNDMTYQGITLAKDLASTDDNKDELQTQNELSSRLAVIVKIWRESIVNYAATIFGGEERNLDLLGRVIANGKMIAEDTEVVDIISHSEAIERSLYALLIPMAWKVSGQDINGL